MKDNNVPRVRNDWNLRRRGKLRGSLVRESKFKSEDPGFDPLAGQGGEHFFCSSESTLVQTCLRLIPPPPPPPPSAVKEQASQPVVWKHGNTAHRGEKKLGSVRESSPHFPCIALGQKRYLILSNLQIVCDRTPTIQGAGPSMAQASSLS